MRFSVEPGAQGGVVLRGRAKAPPARVLWQVTLLALVGTFLLTAGAAVVLASVAWFREDFDFSSTLVRLRELRPGPPHVLLTVGALAMLGLLLTLAAVTLLVQTALTRRVHLEVMPDGWLVRRAGASTGGRELWRVEIERVKSVEYHRAAVVLRVPGAAGGDRRIRGWDADMACLAASLRWALTDVSAARAEAEAPHAARSGE